MRPEQKYRQNKKAITTYVLEPVWMALRYQSFDLRCSMQQITEEALTAVAEHTGRDLSRHVSITYSGLILVAATSAYLGSTPTVLPGGLGGYLWEMRLPKFVELCTVAKLHINPDGGISQFEIAEGLCDWRFHLLGDDGHLITREYPSLLHVKCMELGVTIHPNLPPLPPLPKRARRPANIADICD